eukprot:5971315-Pyramimonas_sp.AAC.1
MGLFTYDTDVDKLMLDLQDPRIAADNDPEAFTESHKQYKVSRMLVVCCLTSHSRRQQCTVCCAGALAGCRNVPWAYKCLKKSGRVQNYGYFSLGKGTGSISSTDNGVVHFHNYGIQNEFEEHPDIVTTRGWDKEFLAKWREGFLSYKKGNWETAREILTICKVRPTSILEIVKSGVVTVEYALLCT